MTKRRLPIGIQTFRKIREEDCYYVDKTAHIRQLLDEGTHYFLSRPRRFGKSLLLDTLKEMFEGNEPLFEGLAIHDRWDWSRRYPVVRLDFSGGSYYERGRSARRRDGAIARLGGRGRGYDPLRERLGVLSPSAWGTESAGWAAGCRASR